ncbi:hypothetical protein C5688_05745 [Methylocystis sp. MitZ-2018]|nr:hypothetical protein C5688_05745 [Methylocystis sp. MitZ-2018]
MRLTADTPLLCGADALKRQPLIPKIFARDRAKITLGRRRQAAWPALVTQTCSTVDISPTFPLSGAPSPLAPQ